MEELKTWKLPYHLRFRGYLGNGNEKAEVSIICEV